MFLSSEVILRFHAIALWKGVLISIFETQYNILKLMCLLLTLCYGLNHVP